VECLDRDVALGGDDVDRRLEAELWAAAHGPQRTGTRAPQDAPGGDGRGPVPARPHRGGTAECVRGDRRERLWITLPAQPPRTVARVLVHEASIEDHLAARVELAEVRRLSPTNELIPVGELLVVALELGLERGRVVV